MDENDFDLADLEKIMWCGLQADAREHNEDLKIEDMEDLLDSANSFGEIMDGHEQSPRTSPSRELKKKKTNKG